MRTMRFGAALLVLAGFAVPVTAEDEVSHEVRSSLDRVRELEQNLCSVFERTSEAYIVVGGGSGVVISPEGDALTNHHVVAGREIGDTFWVRRPGGETVGAKLIGWDPIGDIALLKLSASRPLPFAPLADSDAVCVGDVALALGNPYGFAWDAHPTATLGIVSAVHSYQDNYSDAIQTDAPINPGNSGGPLLNLAGEVIGINGRVAVRFGNRMNTGVGYAIPANQIKRFMPRLQQGGTVLHGKIAGLFVKDEQQSTSGAHVTGVKPDTVAARAGFKAGDVVVSVDGRAVTGANSLYSVVGTYPAGQEINVAVRRGGETVTVRASLEPIAIERDEQNLAWLGVILGGRPAESDIAGAFVDKVDKDSPAAKAGIEGGDLIVAIDGTQVMTSDDLRNLVRSRQPGSKVGVDIVRGDQRITIEVVLGSRKDRK